MLKTKFGTRMLTMLMALIALVSLASCVNVDGNLEETATAAVQEQVEEIKANLSKAWDKTAMAEVTSNLKGFITTTKYENVTVSWTSSRPDVISETGVVTMPSADDKDAVVQNEVKVVPVTVTATIKALVTWGEGESKELTTTLTFQFTVKTEVEGLTSYQALLFIPSHAPYNYYTKEYEKGLELYSKGVMIMDKCSDLLPDYFSFVKGIVDSEDIALNISRETMQQNNQVRLIAKNIEKKIKNELLDMIKNKREDYETFYKAFGMQLKHGLYSNFGMNKETLQDLLLFYSSKEEKYVTLSEYVSRMGKDDKQIYYAAGETINNIKMIPQVEVLLEKGHEILYLTEYLDEFVIKAINEYEGKTFINATDNKLDNMSEEEKEELEKINKDNEDILSIIKGSLKEKVKEVKFTNRLNNHPVCLVSEGEMSLEMEKILNQMSQNSEAVKAETILEINDKHPVSSKLKELYKENNKEEIEKYSQILYSAARMVSGLPVDNPSETVSLICELISK